MRTLLSTIIMLVAAAAFAADPPKPGGTLHFAATGEPSNYDCHASASYAFMHAVRPHYSTLLRFDPADSPKVVGDLAQSWSASEDGLAYTFRLRGGVRFHDGSLLTSADVKASYERLRDPPAGVRSVRRASFADISAIEAPDPGTVVFRLSRPNVGMQSVFASPWNCIYSAARLAEDPRWPEKNVMGTGAFRFVEHVPGSHWLGRRFDGYFMRGRPYLDGYRVSFAPESAITGLQASGAVMAEFRGHAPADRDAIVKVLGSRAVVQESPWLCNLVVSFNTRRKPFDDTRVRRALSLAIDRWSGAESLSRETFVREVGGVLRPGYEYAVAPRDLEALPGFSRNIAASREEAKRLLEVAGHADLRFALLNRDIRMPYEPVANFLIAQWREIGVEATHERRDTRSYIERHAQGAYDAALDFNCHYSDEPNRLLLKYLSEDRSETNYGGYIDRRLDALYDAQAIEPSRSRRAAIIRQFETRALRQAYVVPTIWWHRVVVHDRRVQGWRIAPSHYLNQDLVDVWIDSR